jgi:transglutaminase-like putative cysteine protease
MARKSPLRLILFLGLVPAPSAGAAGASPVVEEIWETATLEGARVGFVRTRVERPASETGRLRTTSALDLTLRRSGATLRLRMEHGTEETADGKVVGVFMRQWHAGGRVLALTGTLEEGRMHVTIDGGRIDRRLPWGDEVVGLYRLEHFFEKRKPRPGERFRLRRYEPTLNTVLTIQVAVKDRETLTLRGKRTELLRVEMVPDKVVVPGHTVRVPPAVWWLDSDFVPVRRQFELEGLGAVTLTRSSHEEAKAPVTAPARAPDIGLKSLVPLGRAIPRPYATRSALYRVTLRGDPEPATAFARDAHQEVRNVRGQTFELLVHPARPGKGDGGADRPAAEFLGSSHFVDCDDARIKELARRAIGAEKDPWKKALRVERWVKGAMRVDSSAPFVPASRVARTLRGDCRQYALLTTALCRAGGVPARTALGLVYVERGSRPYLGFHMWTEVWVGGEWLGVDSTLGRGGVGACHLKVADHSWHDTPSLTPFLPVARVLGKASVEVLRVEHED